MTSRTVMGYLWWLISVTTSRLLPFTNSVVGDGLVPRTALPLTFCATELRKANDLITTGASGHRLHNRRLHKRARDQSIAHQVLFKQFGDQLMTF